MKHAIKSVAAMLLLGLAVAGTAEAAKDKPVDFSGTWKLNTKQSKGAPDWRPETVLVVLQSPYQIHFTYFLNKDATQPFQTYNYVTNGKETQIYSSAEEFAFAGARWNKNVLQVHTHHVIHEEVADTDWVETDTWTLSDDGKTLINKTSDGKIIVYDKQEKAKVY